MEKYVIVSNHYGIQTSLPKDFFIPEKEEPDTLMRTGTNAGGAAIAISGVNNLAEKKLYEIGTRNGKMSGDKASISGYIRDAETGEPVMGANISIDALSISKSTDPFGYYNLTFTTWPTYHSYQQRRDERHTQAITGL